MHEQCEVFYGGKKFQKASHKSFRLWARTGLSTTGRSNLNSGFVFPAEKLIRQVNGHV